MASLLCLFCACCTLNKCLWSWRETFLIHVQRRNHPNVCMCMCARVFLFELFLCNFSYVGRWGEPYLKRVHGRARPTGTGYAHLHITRASGRRSPHYRSFRRNACLSGGFALRARDRARLKRGNKRRQQNHDMLSMYHTQGRTHVTHVNTPHNCCVVNHNEQSCQESTDRCAHEVPCGAPCYRKGVCFA